jgi:hypothetical protein
LVDIGVIDTHFEGRGADDGAHLACGEAGFDGLAFGAFDRGVVDGDVGFIVGQEEGEGEAEPFGGGAGGGEGEGGLGLLDGVDDGVGDAAGVVAGGGEGEGRVDFQAMDAADGVGNDGAGATATEELGDGVGGLGSGGEADALEGVGGAGLEAFEGEGEEGAALVFGEGVDLVDDDRLGLEAVAPGLLGEQAAERLGSGEEQVWAAAGHAGAVGGRGVAGADFHANPVGGGEGGVESFEGFFEVAKDVAAEGAEGGNVDGEDGVGEFAAVGAGAELGEDGEEGGEGFPGAGGGEDEDVAAVEGAAPSELLGLGGGVEVAVKPGG